MSRVELGVDPDRRWHLAGPRPGGGDSDSLFSGLGGDFTAGARSRTSSVAELFGAALESRAAIAIKGAPEQHAEGANVPGDEDG
jgi:hypothetical protein